MAVTREIAQKETDPHGMSSKQPGAKLDAGKSAVWQGVVDYFPRALEAVADLSFYGANKYSWKGWEKVPDGVARYQNAQMRHFTKEAKEGPWDMEIANDPKYPAWVRHATARAWNALAALELILREAEAADFPSAPAVPPHPPTSELPRAPEAWPKGDMTKLPPEEERKPNFHQTYPWGISKLDR